MEVKQGLIRAELVVYKWISYAALLNCEHTIAHCTKAPWHTMAHHHNFPHHGTLAQHGTLYHTLAHHHFHAQCDFDVVGSFWIWVNKYHIHMIMI